MLNKLLKVTWALGGRVEFELRVILPPKPEPSKHMVFVSSAIRTASDPWY